MELTKEEAPKYHKQMWTNIYSKIEPHEIGYDDCTNALLKMWMDDVLTDGEYNRIADKLNKKWGKKEVTI